MQLLFSLQDVVFLVLGLSLGGFLTWFFLSVRYRAAQSSAGDENNRLTSRLMLLEADAQSLSQKQMATLAALDQARHDLQKVREENSALQVRAQQINQLQQELDAVKRESDGLRETLVAVRQASTEANTRLQVQQQEFHKKEQALLESRQLFEREFQLVANRLFEEKSERMTQQNRQQVGELLMPLRDQLQDFRRKVEDAYDKESKDRVALHREISLLRDLNLRVSQDADNLVKALKGDNKTQGNWGELVLERVLELSGLTKGREFDVQPSFRTDDGQWLRPDVIVHLPDGKDVVIDSKVSLLHWETYINAADDNVALDALKNHVQSVKAHIRNLSGKQYEGLPGLRSLDFVLLFIPVEAAFLKIMEIEPQLLADAYAKGLMLVCPSTLLATLRTIQNLWRYEYQNRHALRIAECAGGLHDQFVLVIDAVRELGDKLGKAGQSYDALWKRLADGKGNVMKRVADLETLGAKTRKKLVLDEGSDTSSESSLTEEAGVDTAIV